MYNVEGREKVENVSICPESPYFSQNLVTAEV